MQARHHESPRPNGGPGLRTQQGRRWSHQALHAFHSDADVLENVGLRRPNRHQGQRDGHARRRLDVTLQSYRISFH